MIESESREIQQVSAAFANDIPTTATTILVLEEGKGS